MTDDPKLSLEDSFRQLMEAQQKIDASARKITEAVQRMVDVRSDEVESTRDALAGRDFSWYDTIARHLSANGFGPPQAFESADFASRPVESRALAEYAMNDDGTLIACWFAIPGAANRAESRVVVISSVSEDGHSFDSVQNGPSWRLPQPSTCHEQSVAADLSIEQMLRKHRALVAAHATAMRRFPDLRTYQAARKEEREVIAEFRHGLGLSLVEGFIESRFQGDKAELGAAYIDALRAHPEWYAYSDRGSTTPGTSRGALGSGTDDAAAPMPLRFLMSADEEGRRTITTFGMLFVGLPELVVSGVAANHCRAARFLMSTVARAVGRRRSAPGDHTAFDTALVSAAGSRVMITGADAPTANRGAGRAATPARVATHVSLRGFAAGDEPTLLGINPLPDAPGSLDDRLRSICLKLGEHVPTARPADTMEAAMQEAHERARARLPEMQERFQSGLRTGERLCIKTRRAVSDDVAEYIWLQVHAWRDGDISGEVITPAPRLNISVGQHLSIGDDRVFDHLIAGPEGIVEPSLTDQVAEDYGVDI